MEEEKAFTHFDADGNARMVDVSGKEVTHREALAQGTIRVSEDVLKAIEKRKVKKGDVLSVSAVAGIMAVKHTADLIPMCHVLPMTHASVTFSLDEKEHKITAFCTVKCDGKTGVEMEALTGVTTALLTIYDMCKAIDRAMVMEDIHLVEKTGGKSGTFRFEEAGTA